jgi:hypothetical protein
MPDAAQAVGFAAGIGAALKLSPTVSAGVQALYHNFNLGGGALAVPDDFFTLTARMSIHADQMAAWNPGAPPGSWSGFYAGAHIGTLHNQSDAVIDSVVLSDGEDGTDGAAGTGGGATGGGGGGGAAVAFANLQNDVGLTGGVHFGYNWMPNSTLFGLEADVDASTKDSNHVFGTIRGRLGFATERFLFYSTAGVAAVHDTSPSAIFAGDAQNGASGAAGGAGGAGGDAMALGGGDTRFGFVAGLGVETRLGDRKTAGIEALYYDFENRATPAAPGPGNGFATSPDTSKAVVLRSRISMGF